jgi:NADP oxidoreductase coenzyme F420-dependent
MAASFGLRISVMRSLAGAASTTLAPLTKGLGPGVIAKSPEDALEAEVIFLAVPFSAHKAVANSFKNWNGKIVVAKVYRGKDGALIRTLLAEAQFDPELATAIREKWVLPRRRVTVPYFEQGIRGAFCARI